MTNAEAIEALLDLVDPSRSADAVDSARLVVLGYAERRGKKGFWPSRAGWYVLGDLGRRFDEPWDACAN